MTDSVNNRRHIPSLDGWRAVAILAVLACHSATLLDRTFGLSPHMMAFLSWLRLGVDLFFALSGYLITTNLLNEEANSGGISLKHFYIKRIFRILPPYFFYFAILFIVSFFGVQAPNGYFLLCLFFVRNYYSEPNADGMYTAHFWSLAVEEHFYLIWPLLLVLFRSKKVLWIGIGLALMIEIWRHFVAEYNLFVYGPIASSLIWRTDTRLDSLLWGCIAALCIKRWAHIQLPSFFTPLAVIALVASIYFSAPGLPLIQALIFPILLVSTITNPHGLFTKALEWSPLRFIGRISYSVYIWQNVFLQYTTHTDPPWLQSLKGFPICFISVILTSLFSYFVIEKPAIRLGKKLIDRAAVKIT